MELAGARVLVAGGTGFLGRNVVRELEAVSANVTGIGSADYDLRSRPEIDRLLDETTPDAVVHLAAVTGGIGANRAEPGSFFYENAIMGIELLEACRTHGVGKVVVAGTVCSYPKYTKVPFREEDLWAGYPEETNAPYGLAKKMLLVQSQAYREQYGMNAIHLLAGQPLRPGGQLRPRHEPCDPGHDPALRGSGAHTASPEVVLWGDGSATREFIHVRDAAVAFRLALERYDGGDPVNVGSGSEISIRDLAEKVAALVGYDGTISWDTTKPNGQPSRRLDTSRARELFGFEARTTSTKASPRRSPGIATSSIGS